MQYKNITCIINPSSGKDTPILGSINTVIQSSDADWELHITQKKGDITTYVEQGLKNNSDLFIIYGGDGSVMEAARTLMRTDIPLLTIPGGTANVISKELGLPQNVDELFTMLNTDLLESKKIDMGIVSNVPFLLRVNFGILADMIRKTDTAAKQNYGQLAYGITAASRLQKVTPQHYTIELDSEKIEIDAIGLMVTNMGSVGIGNLTLNQNINSADGLLDIVIVQNLDIGSIFNLAASTLTQADLQGTIKHYQSKQITIQTQQPQTVICDDEAIKLSDHVFSIQPATLTMLVPKKV